MWIFLGDGILVYFRIQLLLVQHWIHVYVRKWRLMVQTAKTTESPQLQFIYGRRLSLRYTEADSHGPPVDHRDFAVAVRVVWSMSLVCSSAAAVLLRGRPHPCRCAESIPWSRQFVRPWIHQLLYKVVDVPVVQVVQVHFPVVAQRQSPWSFDHGHSQLQYTVADVIVVQVVQVHFPVVAQRQSPWSKLFV